MFSRYGDVVKKFRKREGIDQKELARRMNVAQSCISGIENGYRKAEWIIDSLIFCGVDEYELRLALTLDSRRFNIFVPNSKIVQIKAIYRLITVSELLTDKELLMINDLVDKIESELE